MTSAPREVELKLEIKPRDVERVKTRALESGAGALTTTLRSIYFDTRDEALRKAGIALRIRASGAARIQAIKARGKPAGLVLDRAEWESPVVGETPDFAAASGTALAPVLEDEAVRRRIEPLFEVLAQRTAGVTVHRSSEIEIVVDEVEVAAHGRSARFAEVELELKRGRAADLFDLALALSEAIPMRLGLGTKSDRGYDLVADRGPAPVKAEPVALDRGTASAPAFQDIARSCLRQVVLNEAAFRQTRDPVALHQTRVGLRRLRAAITLFKKIVADERSEAIRADLRWAANQLGLARDLDVFIARVIEPALARDGESRPSREILAAYQRRRDEAYEAALQAVDSARFQRIVLATAAWIEAGLWLSQLEGAKHRERPIERHAARQMGRLWKKVLKRGAGLDRIDAEARHQVRIEVKKLRYATEFFGALFVGKGAKKRRHAALKRFETLQDSLGELNDIAVGAMLGTPADASRADGAIAHLLGDQTARMNALLAEARQAHRGLAKLEPFWR